MSVRLYWYADTTQTVTSFSIRKSSDGGLTYDAPVSVLFNVNGANYEKQTKRFFYDDALGAAGNIYKISAVGPLGTSSEETVIVEGDKPPLCRVIGYIKDAFGGVDQTVSIQVKAFGTPGERWAKNTTGMVARNSHALALTSREIFLRPDASGMWSVDLVQGVYAHVSISSLNFEHVFEVPAQAGPVNIRDIPQLRGQDLALFPEYSGLRNVLPES
jgi:hypothetical protein